MRRIGLDYKKIFFFYLLYNPLGYAEFKDPTKPASFSVVTEIKKTVRFAPIKLSAIWISKDSKYVIINGEIAKEGETIRSTIKILHILADSVVIKHRGKKRVIYLLNSFTKK